MQYQALFHYQPIVRKLGDFTVYFRGPPGEIIHTPQRQHAKHALPVGRANHRKTVVLQNKRIGPIMRSEERRVGKESRSGWSPALETQRMAAESGLEEQLG